MYHLIFILEIRDLLVFEIRKNLDLRKILVSPKSFLKSRVHCALFLKVLEVRCSRRKMSGFWTVRILKIFRSSELDVMSGRALLSIHWHLKDLSNYPPPRFLVIMKANPSKIITAFPPRISNLHSALDHIEIFKHFSPISMYLWT